MRFEFGPTDDPDLAKAEALQAIAHDLNRIADAVEGDEGTEPAEIDPDKLVRDLEEGSR